MENEPKNIKTTEKDRFKTPPLHSIDSIFGDNSLVESLRTVRGATYLGVYYITRIPNYLFPRKHKPGHYLFNK